MESEVVNLSRGKMESIVCNPGTGGCGIEYTVPDEWHEMKLRTHETFYCPNGCARVFTPPEPDLPELDLIESEPPTLRQRIGRWIGGF